MGPLSSTLITRKGVMCSLCPLVLQLTADNPGAWPLHCHIAWHVSAGLYVTVVERPDDIAKLTIPSIMAQTCRDWATFTNKTVVDQIDSGL
jgi:hypothetical protein